MPRGSKKFRVIQTSDVKSNKAISGYGRPVIVAAGVDLARGMDIIIAPEVMEKLPQKLVSAKLLSSQSFNRMVCLYLNQGKFTEENSRALFATLLRQGVALCYSEHPLGLLLSNASNRVEVERIEIGWNQDKQNKPKVMMNMKVHRKKGKPLLYKVSFADEVVLLETKEDKPQKSQPKLTREKGVMTKLQGTNDLSVEEYQSVSFDSSKKIARPMKKGR